MSVNKEGYLLMKQALENLTHEPNIAPTRVYATKVLGLIAQTEKEHEQKEAEIARRMDEAGKRFVEQVLSERAA